jgi:RimJ/RimL family protein N-acetyltransferase
MRRRHWYSRPLSQLDPLFPLLTRAECELRQPVEADRESLARLMLSAYRGSVDDDGETLDDTRQEVSAYFAGRDARPLLGSSWLCLVSDELASACLAGWWEAGRVPVIAYVMTDAGHKRRGLAAAALRATLQSLQGQGFAEVRACITEGNTASERLHARLGFVRVAA